MKSYSEILDGIDGYLSSAWTNEGFPQRTYYGENAALAFWSFRKKTIPEQSTEAFWRSLGSRSGSEPEFHHEFINYFSHQLASTSGDPRAISYLENEQYRGSSVCNWQLLRILDRLFGRRNRPRKLGSFSTKIFLRWVLMRHVNKDGLIRDDRLRPQSFPVVAHRQHQSVHYHWFSISLLVDIYELTGWDFVLDTIRSGIRFGIQLILTGGNAIYVGRGQQQILGYGALIFSLEWIATKESDRTFVDALDRVKKFVFGFQRDDGSFPLTLNHDESLQPLEYSNNNPRLPGWYSYNNYFDYLPTFALFLARAQRLSNNNLSRRVHELEQTPMLSSRSNSSRHSGIAIAQYGDLEVAVAKPYGRVSNYLAMPYITYKSRTITPSTGGEEFSRELDLAHRTQLPYFERVQTSVDSMPINIKSNLESNGLEITLTVESSEFTLERRTVVAEKSLQVFDDIHIQIDGRDRCFVPVNVFFYRWDRLSNHSAIIFSDGGVRCEVAISGSESELETYSDFVSGGAVVRLAESIDNSAVPMVVQRTYRYEFYG